MPPVTRSGRGRGRPPLRRRSSPEPASARRVPSPAPVSAPDTQAEILRVAREELQSARAEQQAERERQQRELEEFRAEQTRARSELESTLTRAVDAVREMTAVFARSEKRPVEVETPAGTSDPHSVPQPPLVPQLHLVSHTVSQSHSVSHTIPQPHPVPHTVSRPHSVSPLPQSPPVFASVSVTDISELPVPFPFSLTGSRESPVSTTPAVPYPPLTQSDPVEATRPIHFTQGESSRGPAYHPSEREDIDHFLRDGDRRFISAIDLEETRAWIDTTRPIVEHLGYSSDLWFRMFTGVMSPSTIAWWQSVRSALQGEHAHLPVQQERVVGRRRGRTRGQDQLWSFPSQRQRTEAGAVECQTQRFVPQTQTTHHRLGQQERQTTVQQQRHPQQTATSQDQRPPYQTESYQLYPMCSYCQRRHFGECRRLTGTCFICGGAGHWAAVCPSGVQPQQSQPPYQQPRQRQQPRSRHQSTQQRSQSQPHFHQPPCQGYSQHQQRVVPVPQQRPYRPALSAQSQGQIGMTAAILEEICDVEPLAIEREPDARSEQRRPA